MKKVKLSVWHGCYDKQLKGFITNESFSHPAKYSLGLIERIFDYCLERGYLKRGDVVGDCFGGVAIGGLVATYRGLRWVGVELEPKFVGFCQANIALHKSKLETMGRPLPVIVHGDSRRFHELVEASAIVSSPPYADSIDRPSGIDPEKVQKPGGPNCQTHHDIYGKTAGQIGRLKAGEVAGVISSPPFTQTPDGAKGINVEGYNGRSDIKPDFLGSRTYQGQGGDRADGKIETLKAGDIQAVISSPPYSDIAAGAGGLNTKPPSKPGQQAGRKAQSASQDTDQKYGRSEGQISQLKGGSVEAVVSSPPFRDARSDTTKAGATKGGGPCAERLHSVQAGITYGESEGQIDNLKTGDVHAVVSSPPWESNSEGVMKASKFKDPIAFAEQARQTGHGASLKAKLKAMAADESRDSYGDSPGQIGKEKAESYWEAMAEVYASCHKAIKPGGYIVLVLKDYVKGGKRVPLCDDTCKLLEHVGFTVIERIHAMLVKETRHEDLFNGHTVHTKSRKSFFRRLAEKNGSPKIDFEEVIIARR